MLKMAAIALQDPYKPTHVSTFVRTPSPAACSEPGLGSIPGSSDNFTPRFLRRATSTLQNYVGQTIAATAAMQQPFTTRMKVIGAWLAALGFTTAILFGAQQWISNANNQEWNMKSGIWANCMANENIRSTKACTMAFGEAWGGVSMWQKERFVWEIYIPYRRDCLVSSETRRCGSRVMHQFDFGIQPYRTSLVPPAANADKSVIHRTVRSVRDKDHIYPGEFTEMPIFINMSAIPTPETQNWGKYRNFAPGQYQMSNITSQIKVPSARFAEFTSFARLFHDCSPMLGLELGPSSKNLRGGMAKCIERIWKEAESMDRRARTSDYLNREESFLDVRNTLPWSQLCKEKRDGSLECADEIGRIVIQHWNVGEPAIRVQPGSRRG